jgi:hypothetical protein
MLTINNTENIFPELILGLALLTQEQKDWMQKYPPVLLRAMAAISLEMGAKFPKTVTAFLGLCQQPLKNWYPYKLRNFTINYALLDNKQLTEQASDYLYEMPSEMSQQIQTTGFIPTSVLDNWEMVRFIEQVRGMDDSGEAQRQYTIIRSFLIEHSWITKKNLMELKRQGISEEGINWLKTTFYHQEDNEQKVIHCDYCGILRLENNHLVGIKPTYCSDHQWGLPHVHSTTVSSYSRLKMGIHLRTFIPGQAELALFNEAEALQHEYPEHLIDVVRYPALDTYDLQLVFRDEVWAVDVKDYADPLDLKRKITPIRKANNRDHAKAFYVVPDRRLRFIPDYLDQVRRYTKIIRPPLFLLSQQEICNRMKAKCAELVKASC